MAFVPKAVITLPLTILAQPNCACQAKNAFLGQVDEKIAIGLPKSYQQVTANTQGTAIPHRGPENGPKQNKNPLG